jgi:ribonuclease-3
MPERVVHWVRNLIPSRGAPSTLDELVKREFGLRIKVRSHYDEALTHASLLDGDETGLKSNERLEFLGDRALDLAVATYLFDSFPDDQEGALTQRKSKIVNRKTLNLLGERMGLPAFIRSKMRRKDIQDSVVGNALEALIGAIYLDHGYLKTSKAVLRMMKRHGADEKVHQTMDFKSKLFHWSQTQKKEIDFRVVSESSSEGESNYVMEVLVDGRVFGEAKGKSKKEAEQAASRVAWKAVFDRGLLAEQPDAEQPAPKKGRPRGPRGEGARKKAEQNKASKKQAAQSPASETSGQPRRRMRRKGGDSVE